MNVRLILGGHGMAMCLLLDPLHLRDSPMRRVVIVQSLLLLPSVSPSIRDFSNESALCIRWLKYWSFGTSPSNIQG